MSALYSTLLQYGACSPAHADVVQGWMAADSCEPHYVDLARLVQIYSDVRPQDSGKEQQQRFEAVVGLWRAYEARRDAEFGLSAEQAAKQPHLSVSASLPAASMEELCAGVGSEQHPLFHGPHGGEKHVLFYRPELAEASSFLYAATVRGLLQLGQQRAALAVLREMRSFVLQLHKEPLLAPAAARKLLSPASLARAMLDPEPVDDSSAAEVRWEEARTGEGARPAAAGVFKHEASLSDVERRLLFAYANTMKHAAELSPALAQVCSLLIDTLKHIWTVNCNYSPIRFFICFFP